MKFAQKTKNIKPSATLAINAKSLELKAQGLPVISLAVGEPDFPTPTHICAAAKAAIDEGFTKYTAIAGIAPLRQAVADYFLKTTGVGISAEAVMVNNGGKQALYNLLQALICPGDEVLIPVPYWVSYPDMVYLAEGTPVFVQPQGDDFKVTVNDLARYFTPKVKVLIFNSPSNPSGVCYTQEEVDAIMTFAVEQNIFVISDEIYDQLVYEPATPVRLAPWWAEYPENFAIVNGLAKSFAMTGWRVGFTLADPALIKMLIQIQGHSTANVCSIAQKAALAALTSPFDCIDSMRADLKRRRDLALAEVNSWPGVRCAKPDGAFYLFLDISALFKEEYPDALSMTKMLLDEALVAVVPGEEFGDPRCIRLSYAVSDAVLMEALQRMRKALYSCTPKE